MALLGSPSVRVNWKVILQPFLKDAAYFPQGLHRVFEMLQDPALGWKPTRETEDLIAKETMATIRCIPFDRPKEAGKCMMTGKPSQGRVVFAKAY